MRFLTVFLCLAGAASAFYLHADGLLDRALKDYTEEEALAFIQELEASGRQTDLYLGIVYHNLSRSCPEKYIEKAIHHLQTAWDTTHDTTALAYLGSAVTVKAGMAAERGDFASAIADLEEGIQKLDSAVDRDSQNIMLRFVRMINAFEVTENSPLDRLAVAKEDLQYLETHYHALNASQKALYKFCEAKIALAEDHITHALSCLEEAIRLNPQSQTARDAHALLLEWEE
jgi:tetratricopeptide (TPR) repeat protein